jgi:hypothetical protein
VRPEGANHQWRRNPPRELSIDLVADERLVRVTGQGCSLVTQADITLDGVFFRVVSIRGHDVRT